MRAAPVALTAIAGVLLLMLTFAGILFLGIALYLGVAAWVHPVLAALITAGILLAPLMAAALYLFRQIHRRRSRRAHRRRELDALKAALQASAQNDPYGFVTAAFVSGVLLSAKSTTRQRVAQFMDLCSGLYTSS